MKHPVIALLTDFGNGDFFVGSMKGVIAGILPAAKFIDITHEVPSFNIKAAAFVLRAAYRYFPRGTIFLVVVDPGVGTNRKVILVKTEDYHYIAPDNGVLSLTLQHDLPMDMCEVSNPEFFLPEVSCTFEARDRMAPVAARLASGTPLKKFGPVLPIYEKLELAEPVKNEEEIRGEVLYADKFGNLITNIPEDWLHEYIKEGRKELFLSVGETRILYQNSYAEAGKGELLSLPGSLGLVELAVREGSAAERLNLLPGASVRINK